LYRGLQAFEAEVSPRPILKLIGNFIIAIEAWSIVDAILGLGNFYDAVLLIDTHKLHRYQARPTEPKEAHLYAYVLFAVS
jgi:hypothetical protein